MQHYFHHNILPFLQMNARLPWTAYRYQHLHRRTQVTPNLLRKSSNVSLRRHVTSVADTLAHDGLSIDTLKNTREGFRVSTMAVTTRSVLSEPAIGTTIQRNTM